MASVGREIVAPPVAPAAAHAGRPLLAGDDAVRALAIAQRIFARGLRWTFEQPPHSQETIGRFSGCLLVGAALLRAGRTIPSPLRDIAKAALVTAPDRRGLYDGRAGLLVVLDAIDEDGTAFARPRAGLRAAIAQDLLQTRELDPLRRIQYDLISGAAGKLLALRDVPDAVAEHVRALFAAFADRFEECRDDPDHDGAHVDIGVAHGMPGILAALNVALPGERELARRYAELILSVSHDAGGARRWGPWWSRDRVPPPRRAWCYQTVGVAAVLHDRALIDGDETLRALALDALDGTLREPDPAHWDDALCHGRSGVALIYSRIHTDDGRFVREAERLARAVLHGYREDAAFGYRAYDLPTGTEMDRPEFLDAALGVAMFLIEAAAPSRRRWLPLLGLRPDAA